MSWGRLYQPGHTVGYEPAHVAGAILRGVGAVGGHDKLALLVGGDNAAFAVLTYDVESKLDACVGYDVAYGSYSPERRLDCLVGCQKDNACRRKVFAKKLTVIDDRLGQRGERADFTGHKGGRVDIGHTARQGAGTQSEKPRIVGTGADYDDVGSGSRSGVDGGDEASRLIIDDVVVADDFDVFVGVELCARGVGPGGAATGEAEA